MAVHQHHPGPSLWGHQGCLLQAVLAGIIMSIAGIPAVGVPCCAGAITGSLVPVLPGGPSRLHVDVGDHGTLPASSTVLLLVAAWRQRAQAAAAGTRCDAPMPVVPGRGRHGDNGILDIFSAPPCSPSGISSSMAWSRRRSPSRKK